MSKIENRSCMVAPTAVEGDRILWPNLLARYAVLRRHELELTVARAAELSGLAISEWSAMEQGCWAPEELNTVRAVAATLNVRWTDLDFLAFFARCHQGNDGCRA